MMVTKRILVAGLLAVLLAGASAAVASSGASRLVTHDGSVHAITVTVPPGDDESATAPTGNGPTVLVHAHSHPDGSTDHYEVPGTTDDIVESHPFLTRDARPGGVVLVWTRGGPGSAEVVISRFDGEIWSDPVEVTDGPGEAGEARTVVHADGRVRVFWVEEGPDNPQIFTRLLDVDLVPAGPGEPVGVGEELDLDGAPGRTALPFEYDLHVIFRTSVGGRERMVLCGVRDVPTPIGTIMTRLDFVLPADASDVSDPKVTMVEGNLFVRVLADGELVYTAQSDAYGWNEYRKVAAGTKSRKAVELLLIEEMLAASE